jgi:hypothetical protein
MQEDLIPISDVITMVANDQPGEATQLVHDLLGARISEALQGHKEVIAQSLFAPSADTLEEAEQLDERAKYNYERVRVHPATRSKYQKIHGSNWFGRYLKDNPKAKEKARIKEETEQ